MLTWAKNQLSFIGCDADYASADIVVFGAPFDATTSYRSGTRDASRVMRGESFSIETYSPYQNRDLEDYAVFDGGDLDLPFGNPSVALDRIQKTISSVFADQKRPLMIGG
ncbi:MAG: arginase family protein, partial [Eubacteriales bacterium]|nr:arginase family protein [Eubacteriales bacterium]